MANKFNYEAVVQTDTGAVVPGAEYTVTNEKTGLPLTIYSDRAGTTTKTAPYFADTGGKVQFFTDPGVLFRVEAVGGSGTASKRYIEAIQLTESDADTEAGRAQKVGLLGVGAQLVTAETAFNAGVYLVSGAHLVTPNLDTCSSVPPELAGVAKRGIMHVVGSSGGVLQLLSVREGSGLWYRSVTNVLVSGNDWVRFDPQAYGVGELIGSTETNLSAGVYLTPGIKIFTPFLGTCTGAPAGVVDDRATLEVVGGSTTITQFLRPRTGDLYVRSGVSLASDGSDWERVYSSANLLGTVSQSGGVPTGAVIERGSNANGEYVKFADGTLICTATLTLAYDSATDCRLSWTYPSSFVTSSQAPVFSITGDVATTTSVTNADISMQRATLAQSTSILLVYTASGASFSPGDTIPVSASVSGRWY